MGVMWSLFFSFEDLGQVGQVRHWAIVTEVFRVQICLLDQRSDRCFFEHSGHSARPYAQIDYLLKHR